MSDEPNGRPEFDDHPPRDPLFAPCSICAARTFVAINGRTYCLDHVDVGFLDIARMIAVFRGLDVDNAERLARIAIS